jgi:hypothetical protein
VVSKSLGFVLTSASLLCGVSGTASAGPLGTYYLTDYQNANIGFSSLDAIQRDAYVQNQSVGRPFEEGPIAVVGQFVRTTGTQFGNYGGEYVSAPSLSVAGDGNTWFNDISAAGPFSYTLFYDGTSDGVAQNYTVEYNSGDVVATDLQWGGGGVVLFSTGNAGDQGITWDRWNHSFWIQNF